MNLVLKRVFRDNTQTLGVLQILTTQGVCVRILATIELPYRNNQKNISCIPEGRYRVRERYSSKFGNHIEVLDVPNRSLILIHKGNYNQDTEGCIIVGQYFEDINHDGNLDVANSGRSMKSLMDFLGGDMGTLTIVNCDPKDL